MTGISGPALIAIGALHTLLALFTPGLLGFPGIWEEIAAAGVFDAVSVDAPRIWGWYWFLVPGPLLILLGVLCHWIEQRLRQRLPPFLGAGLLALCLIYIALDVDTGLWLVLAVAINMLIASRARARTLP